MTPKLYIMYESPPARAVIITAKALKLDLQYQEINCFKSENIQDWYIQMNPQHTVPTLLDDDGFTIWDSHAIMIYLITKYGKNDSLYPQDVKKRAIINQRLHFESGVVFNCLKTIGKYVFSQDKTSFDPELIKDVVESYGFLEKFLQGHEWMAGDFLSIADYSLLSSVGTLKWIVPIDEGKFPKVVGWLEKCEELPEYQGGASGLADLLNTRKLKELTQQRNFDK